MDLEYTELYLANSIESLKCIANGKISIANKFETKCKALDRLYQSAQTSLLNDQEKAYVYLYRFLVTFKKCSALKADKDFMDKRFETQLKKTKKYLEQLERDLKRRYAERENSDKENRKPIERSSVSSPRKKFPENFITCDALYSALNDPTNNILLVDARPEEDFQQSRMSKGQLINVPEHIIQSGLSAHCIGSALPVEFQAIWNKRETFDVMVLFDWNSTFDDMVGSKLEKLLSSLVDWDTNKMYVQKPIILNGGYSEWGQYYPSLCMNPHIIMNRMNNELDELLNLDDIQYPSDENRVPIITFQQPRPKSVEPSGDAETREDLIRKNKELSMQSDLVLNELMAQEEKYKINMANDKNTEQLQELEKSITNLEQQLETLIEQKKKTQEQFDLYARFDPQNENLEQDQIKEIADIDKSDNEKILVLQTIAQERLDALAKARALKPKSSGEPNVIVSPTPSSGPPWKGGKTERPLVNRANKPAGIMQMPRIFDYPISFNPEGGGLVGLRNIKNTCYMNTVVQCMRTIPKLATLFCTGQYSSLIRKKPGAIIMETAFLFRSLWSNIHKFFSPDNFYERVCSIEPNYRMGNHEDCMEFFLFLLNILNEDCAYDLPKPEVMSPIQQAWFNQLGGKMSAFTEIFYHQLRITQVCPNCNIKTYKFEIESTVMLPVTANDFKIEDLMKNYMQDYVIDDYHCSKCRKPVRNSKSVCVAPNILVIVLKRYKQIIRNNNSALSKVDSRATFPKTGFLFGKEEYRLHSIAMHSGSLTSGHYTAACCINSKWYEFNDEMVRPINIDEDSVRSKACAFFYSKE